MKIEIVDYHFFTVEDAVVDFEKRLWSLDTTINGKSFELITGFAKIQAAIIAFLDKVPLKWNYKPGNRGCLLVEVEPYEGSIRAKT